MTVNRANKKLLSCQFCKQRKIKCNCEHPCSNCIKFNVKCVPIIKDLRKKKFSNTYVATLKNKADRMESFISHLKNSDPNQRELLLRNFEISGEKEDGEMIGEGAERNTENVEIPSRETDGCSSLNKTRIVVEKRDASQIAVYGKPSIFIPPTWKKKRGCFDLKEDFDNFHCPVILKYISNFFKWRYMENNLFIYRESFLTDFYRDKDDLKESLDYCNEELIFAICANGSKLDYIGDFFLHKGVLYDSPEKFYTRARYLIFQKLNSDDCNTITTIQTLLCLAFFDLGRGRVLSAWVLAGIAFRIGMHMGFELNLNQCRSEESDSLFSDYDLNVKSRIYWGCRLADYYISFVLGRSPTLEHLRATIPQSENLPTLPGIDFFLYQDPVTKRAHVFNISKPLERLNSLYKLVNKYHKMVYQEAPETDNNGSEFQICHSLGNFNLEVFEWRDKLEGELYWTKAELRTTGYDPNKMFFRYQYYLVLLSFNRDFVGIDYDIHNLSSPKNICIGAIEDVYTSIQNFSTYHNFKYVSLTVVYLSILCITILQKVHESSTLTVKRCTMVKCFATLLKESSTTWDIANSAYISFIPVFQELGLNYEIDVAESGNTEISASKSSFPSKVQRPEEEMADFDQNLIPSLNYS